METTTTSGGWVNTDDMFSYKNIMATVNNNNDNSADDNATAGNKRAKTNTKPQFKQCGLPSRQQEFNELGVPDTRAICFGCWFNGEREAGATSSQDIEALMNIIRKTISKTDPVNLAIYLAERYEQIQADVNDALMPNEKPLPDWTAATILDHLRNHNTDPELQTWHRITEFQELQQIALNSMVVVDPETGAMQLDDKQAKLYMDLVKQTETLYKSDPSKKLYYSGGNHIDMKAASEGPICYSGKNLIDFWNNKS